MNLTDTHCHLNLDKFDSDRSDVIDRAFEAGLKRILIPSIDLITSRNVVELVSSHPSLFAAIGVHPNNAMSWDADSKEQLLGLSAACMSPDPYTYSKIVAIGEIGLDYYWNDAPHDIQNNVLLEQLEIASILRLPVILHMREKGDLQVGECSKHLLQMLSEWTRKLLIDGNPLASAPGVLHSFSGSLAAAEEAIAMNFFIGVTGPITYKNAESKREVVKSLPLEKILIETDSPYLAPNPFRGQRNEPAYICHITDKIAEIHKKDPEEIAWFTSENAKRLFSWGG